MSPSDPSEVKMFATLSIQLVLLPNEGPACSMHTARNPTWVLMVTHWSCRGIEMM
jgi:hypothetical protein